MLWFFPIKQHSGFLRSGASVRLLGRLSTACTRVLVPAWRIPSTWGMNYPPALGIFAARHKPEKYFISSTSSLRASPSSSWWVKTPHGGVSNLLAQECVSESRWLQSWCHWSSGCGIFLCELAGSDAFWWRGCCVQYGVACTHCFLSYGLETDHPKVPVGQKGVGIPKWLLWNSMGVSFP